MSIEKYVEFVKFKYKRGLGKVKDILIDVERRNENSEVGISVGSGFVFFVLY